MRALAMAGLAMANDPPRSTVGHDAGPRVGGQVRTLDERTYVLVVGLGDTGLSCVRHLLDAGRRVCVADSRDNPPNAQPAFEADKTVGYINLKMEF